jgi:hypothetical protein
MIGEAFKNKAATNNSLAVLFIKRLRNSSRKGLSLREKHDGEINTEGRKRKATSGTGDLFSANCLLLFLTLYLLRVNPLVEPIGSIVYG